MRQNADLQLIYTEKIDSGEVNEWEIGGDE